jgi:hypothetical protein
VWFGAGAFAADVLAGIAIVAGAAYMVERYCRRFAISLRFSLRGLLSLIASVACYAALELGSPYRHRNTELLQFELQTIATVAVYAALTLAWLAVFDGAVKRLLAGLWRRTTSFWTALTTRHYVDDA